MTEIEIKGQPVVIVPIETDTTCYEWLLKCEAGEYEYITRWFIADEVVLDNLIGEPNTEMMYRDFRRDKNSATPFCFLHPRSSFKSLLQHHSLDPNADYIILKRKKKK